MAHPARSKTEADVVMELEAQRCERAKPCESVSCTTCRQPELIWAYKSPSMMELAKWAPSGSALE